MNDHAMEQTKELAMPFVSDVKHYAITLDENGNEVRKEITPVKSPDTSK